MAGDADLKTLRAELRMNAYATHGGVDRTSFELYARGKHRWRVRVQSHYKLLRETG
jgi:alkyl hydroperoxide reductase subunit D